MNSQNNITINTGEVRLTINNDPARVITFNPSDLIFAERFYRLIGTIERQLMEYKERAVELRVDSTTTEDGLPSHVMPLLELMRETSQFMRASIDEVFGDGTSQTAFGDAVNLDMFSQFLDGVTPFIKVQRAARIEKYVPIVKKSRSHKGKK